MNQTITVDRVLERLNAMDDRQLIRFAIWCAVKDPGHVDGLLDRYEADGHDNPAAALARD